MQIEPSGVAGAAAGTDGVPIFRVAGSPAFGEFRCAQCGYGVTVRQMLPVCPMCRGRSWEDPATSPYVRSRA